MADNILEVKKLKDKFKPAGWPLIRGIVNMVESLTFGFKCIEKSAEKAGLDDDNIPEEEMSKLDKWLNDQIKSKLGELDDSELVALHNEGCSRYDYYDDYIYNDLAEMLEGLDVENAINRVYYGEYQDPGNGTFQWYLSYLCR